MSVSLNIAKECFILKWLVLREKLYLSLVKHKSCFFPSPPPLCGSIQAESNYVAQQGDHVRYVQNYQSNCVYISFSLYMSPPPHVISFDCPLSFCIPVPPLPTDY